MSRWSRRRVLTALAVLPVGAAATAARAAGSPVAGPAASPALSPPTAPAAVVDPVLGLAGAQDAVGVIGPVDVRPVAASAQGSGRLVGAAPGLRAAAPDLPFSFRATSFAVNRLPANRRPYTRTVAEPLVDVGTHDASGVRMFRWKDQLEDHPVAQAQYGLALLESYRLTRDARYLARARLQAQRLVARRVTRGVAWFYPYDFTLPVHGSDDVFPAPWYSMMAQGQALSLFVRLFEVTHTAAWRRAADATFASFLLPFDGPGTPWGVYVKDDLLRLEEYPDPTRDWGDETYNGHVFAVFGLYDYVMLTGDARARALLQGGLTTARDLVPQLRVRDYRSHYCLRHRGDAGRYHVIHIDQLLMLQATTGDAAFARAADQLWTDFAPPVLTTGTRRGARVLLAAGAHPAHRFDTTGVVTARKTFTASRPTAATALERTRIRGRGGYWYKISGGALAGWYLPEAPPARYVTGTRAAITYPVARPARVRTARPPSVVVADSGAVSTRRTGYRVGARVTVDQRAVLNGVEHYRLASGPHRRRWLRASSLTVS